MRSLGKLDSDGGCWAWPYSFWVLRSAWMGTEVGGKQRCSLSEVKGISIEGRQGLGGFPFTQKQGLRSTWSCRYWGREVSELPWDKSRDMRS